MTIVRNKDDNMDVEKSRDSRDNGRFMHRLVATAITVALFILVGWTMQDDMKNTLYLLLLCAVVWAEFFISEYLRSRKKSRDIHDAAANEENIEELLPKPEGQTERAYDELLRKVIRDGKIADERMKIVQADADEYYTMWIHQIKTPIAAMQLLISSQEQGENKRLMSSEMMQIESYCQMALNYLKLGDDEQDFVFKEYELFPMVKKVVKKYAASFIDKKISLNILENGTCGSKEQNDSTQNDDLHSGDTALCDSIQVAASRKILTDEKWFCFLFEQIFSNAVKYTKQGGITIYADDSALYVEDTGIGIREDDIPRIFEKGYTGLNGRLDQRATGIGLYLAKTTADKLNISISVQSQSGVGSKFALSFPPNERKMFD